jgi:hypothetical protein
MSRNACSLPPISSIKYFRRSSTRVSYFARACSGVSFAKYAESNLGRWSCASRELYRSENWPVGLSTLWGIRSPVLRNWSQ